VERDTDGFVVGKKEDKLGIRASSTVELSFSGCRVPAANLVGEEGQGYKIAIEQLNEGRIGIGAQMVGLAQGALDHTLRYVQEREQFGRPIGQFQGVQFQLADMRTEIEAARLLVYNAARLKEANRPFLAEAAMAKLFASESAQRVASLCVDLFGGYGFTKEYPIEKLYRDAKVGTIYEGTSNMQRQTIAKLPPLEGSRRRSGGGCRWHPSPPAGNLPSRECRGWMPYPPCCEGCHEHHGSTRSEGHPPDRYRERRPRGRRGGAREGVGEAELRPRAVPREPSHGPDPPAPRPRPDGAERGERS
jgi:hypothetical protein